MNPFLIFLLFITLSIQSPDEYRLIQDLKENYDIVERPVRNHTDSLPVKVGIILQQIVDIDERNQAMTLVVWTQITWRDYKLNWRPSEYGNITSVQLPKAMLWTPDILLYNSVNSNFDSTFTVNCVTSNEGEVLMAPPGIVKISCDMSMTWFPFDEQICFMKYGSWTYSGSFVDLNIDNANDDGVGTIDMTYYLANEEFNIMETIAKRTIKFIKGEPHIELYFMIILKRRSLYYTLNWIIPSILISMSNILQFMMPTAGGEKVTLQTTNVLATLVFLTQIAKTTPATSDSIPVLCEGTLREK
ncbi:unnamed protein product [Auanema sp. JU1783]|nr:unnamed protein product [Auanema sp. JU1783]